MLAYGVYIAIKGVEEHVLGAIALGSQAAPQSRSSSGSHRISQRCLTCNRGG